VFLRRLLLNATANPMRWLAGLLAIACFPAYGSERNTDARLILQTSPLAGFQHYAGAALFPLMAPGQHLHLYREPANPFDPKAVRVEWNGVQIGYAPRVDNVDLARLMDRGVAVEGRILHLQKGRDPWKRVLMEIYVVEPGSGAAPPRLSP
jgi:hypothetical protein